VQDQTIHHEDTKDTKKSKACLSNKNLLATSNEQIKMDSRLTSSAVERRGNDELFLEPSVSWYTNPFKNKIAFLRVLRVFVVNLLILQP